MINNKSANRCKVGELRPSQVLTTFGIGSIVDLPNLSVMVMGLEDWPLKDTVEIGEPRLLSSVQGVLGEQAQQRPVQACHTVSHRPNSLCAFQLHQAGQAADGRSGPFHRRLQERPFR